MFSDPVGVLDFIENSRHLLELPVNNKVVQEGDDFFLMLVGGPNNRTDYHINPMEEWFFQLKGEMLLKIVDLHTNDPKNRFRDITIKEGECYLLAAQVPHNPIRFPNTYGLVMERRRIPGQHLDRLRWYCEACRAPLHEETFFLEDVEGQLKELLGKYEANEHLRTCTHCGAINRG